jgi:exonuclease III
MPECLTFLNWNVRGLNSPAQWEATRELIQSVKPMIVCLQEMKLSSIPANVAAEVLGMNLDSFVYHPASGTRGGILLGWQTTFIEGLHPRINGFSLSMIVKHRWLTHAFLLTSVYGPSEDVAKLSFLNELQTLKPLGTMPWIVIGDFNLIYKHKTKAIKI